MRHKKHPNKNTYLLTKSGLWVRDFTHPYSPYIDINNITSSHDYKYLIQNELENRLRNMQHIDTEEVNHSKILIVSDGYQFEEKQHLLSSLPKDVVVIAVNGALASWQLLEGEYRQRIHYYVVNNPYKECMNFFPRKNRYFTRCIASMRTNPEFIRQFAKKGTMYRYLPTPEKNFVGMKSDALYHIDDYRNPICAAIGLAYRMGVEKLLFYCCDDSFSDRREGAVAVGEGLYTYPQQLVSRDLIDGNCYWLKTQEDTEVKIGDCSSGMEYKNISYIRPDQVVDFFKGN